MQVPNGRLTATAPEFRPGRDAILLDVDGTLIDIAPRPDLVHAPQSLLDTMRALMDLCAGAFALVSGRTLDDLDRIFSPHLFPAIGCHGAQFRAEPDRPPEVAGRVPDTIQRGLVELAAADPRILVENKGFSVTLHYRHAPDRERALIDGAKARLEALGGRDLRILGGKKMIEIAPAAVNKGTAVRTLMNRAPFAGRRPVFLGDDVTDEDVFRILPEIGGVGISVGRRMAGADFMFGTPGEVRAWLARIVEDAK